MMKRIRYFGCMVVSALMLVMATPRPAPADSGVSLLVGQMTTQRSGNAGVWSITTDSCGAAFPTCNRLSLGGDYSVGHSDPQRAADASTVCLASGTGSGTYGPHSLRDVTWTASAGSRFVITAVVDGGGHFVAEVDMEVASPASCVWPSSGDIGARVLVSIVH